jgi:hypothetical protein
LTPASARLGAALIAATVVGCPRQSSDPPPPATARIIDAADQLLWGPAASGALGDVRLENDKLVAVVAAPSRAVGFASSGGNLIDLAPRPDGEDHLNQVLLYLADHFPRQARYTDLEVTSAGGGRRPAKVRVRGLDTKHDGIAIETEYSLEPGASWLTITTRFTSSSTGTIRAYAMGDAVQWGRVEPLAPGHGFELAGKRVAADWFAGTGPGTSYAIVPDGPLKMEGMNGSMWSDPIGLTADLEPKKPVIYVRHFVVGKGDTASLQPAIARLRGDQTGRITGTVHHQGTPVRDAVVHVVDAKGKLAGTANVDAAGWYAIDLVPGEYSAEAVAPGRKAARAERAEPLELGPGATEPLNFNVGPEAVITWRIEGDDGFAPAVRVTIHGAGDTPTPNFGPLFRGSGSRNVILSQRGMGTAPVGVGKFRVIISHGPEFELIEREVEVPEGGRIEITGRLVRSVDTRGLIAADLHQHAVPSFDSGVSLVDRAISNAAEGVEVLVSTEHNVAVDYRNIIASTGLGRSLISIVGTEATTHSVGHFNAFPLQIRRDDPRGGMRDVEGMTPKQIFDLVRGLGFKDLPTFVQVNHPRAGSIGYFDLMKLDPTKGTAADQRFDRAFDGLEVMFFGFRDETDAAIADWFSLLRNGNRVTATGNSDSHSIFGREVGWPRTFVCLDDDSAPRLDPATFTSALKRGCATISAGPIVTIQSGASHMGDLVRANRGRFSVEVTVRAASWIATDRLVLYVDGQPAKEVPLSGRQPERHASRHELSCKQDCFVVALVDSDQSLEAVLAPYADRAPRPLALTNPIYVDIDGDGQFQRAAK